MKQLGTQRTLASRAHPPVWAYFHPWFMLLWFSGKCGRPAEKRQFPSFCFSPELLPVFLGASLFHREREGASSLLVMPLWNRFIKRTAVEEFAPGCCSEGLPHPFKGLSRSAMHLNDPNLFRPKKLQCLVWKELCESLSVCWRRARSWHKQQVWWLESDGGVHLSSAGACACWKCASLCFVSAAVWLGGWVSWACVKALGEFSASVSKTIPMQWIEQLQQQLWNAL